MRSAAVLISAIYCMCTKPTCVHCDCIYVVCVFSRCSSFVSHAQVCSRALQRPRGGPLRPCCVDCLPVSDGCSEKLGPTPIPQQQWDNLTGKLTIFVFSVYKGFPSLVAHILNRLEGMKEKRGSRQNGIPSVVFKPLIISCSISSVIWTDKRHMCAVFTALSLSSSLLLLLFLLLFWICCNANWRFIDCSSSRDLQVINSRHWLLLRSTVVISPLSFIRLWNPIFPLFAQPQETNSGHCSKPQRCSHLRRSCLPSSKEMRDLAE